MKVGNEVMVDDGLIIGTIEEINGEFIEIRTQEGFKIVRVAGEIELI